MNDARESRPLILLGATGRVGRMLRHDACRPAWGATRLIAAGRNPDGPDCVRWRPSDPPGDLPRETPILSLLGVTSGDVAALAANTDLALAAQSLGAALGAPLVLHASSAAVYGAAPPDACHEDAPLIAPANAYGAAKRAMEAALVETDGPPTLCLRIANVAGADSLFRNIARGAPMTLDRFADGCGPLRSYVAPQDLARVVAALVTSPAVPRGALNVAAPGAVDMADVLRAARTPFTRRPAPPEALARMVLSTDRLRGVVDLSSDTAAPAHLVAAARAVGALP